MVVAATEPVLDCCPHNTNEQDLHNNKKKNNSNNSNNPQEQKKDQREQPQQCKQPQQGAQKAQQQQLHPNSKQLRARGRWKLLQRALLSSASSQKDHDSSQSKTVSSDATSSVSIHRFVGYKLLPDPIHITPSISPTVVSTLVQNLHQLHVTLKEEEDKLRVGDALVEDSLADQIEGSILALLALEDEEKREKRNINNAEMVSFVFSIVAVIDGVSVHIHHHHHSTDKDDHITTWERKLTSTISLQDVAQKLEQRLHSYFGSSSNGCTTTTTNKQLHCECEWIDQQPEQEDIQPPPSPPPHEQQVKNNKDSNNCLLPLWLRVTFPRIGTDEKHRNKYRVSQYDCSIAVSGTGFLSADNEEERNKKEDDNIKNNNNVSLLNPPKTPLLHSLQQQQQHTILSITVLTRERLAFRPSLEELTSHHRQQVDNTGNVCVWDSEKTLTWVVWNEIRSSLQFQQQLQLPNNPSSSNNNGAPSYHHGLVSITPPETVLELGVGMAGLAALSLGAGNIGVKTIYLTDGHDACVQNNRANVRLMEAHGLLSKCHVQCRKLLWSIGNSSNSSCVHADQHQECFEQPSTRADWTLVSDCTHFQEFHACLYWTLLQHTRVGGLIWLCQPDRANSLQRFLALVEHANNSSDITSNNNDSADVVLSPTNALPHLVEVMERHYHAIETIHERIISSGGDDDDNTNNYDPNIHRPRVFVLKKLRRATEHDRLRILKHMEERDKQ